MIFFMVVIVAIQQVPGVVSMCVFLTSAVAAQWRTGTTPPREYCSRETHAIIIIFFLQITRNIAEKQKIASWVNRFEKFVFLTFPI